MHIYVWRELNVRLFEGASKGQSKENCVLLRFVLWLDLITGNAINSPNIKTSTKMGWMRPTVWIVSLFGRWHVFKNQKKEVQLVKSSSLWLDHSKSAPAFWSSCDHCVLVIFGYLCEPSYGHLQSESSSYCCRPSPSPQGDSNSLLHDYNTTKAVQWRDKGLDPPSRLPRSQFNQATKGTFRPPVAWGSASTNLSPSTTAHFLYWGQNGHSRLSRMKGAYLCNISVNVVVDVCVRRSPLYFWFWSSLKCVLNYIYYERPQKWVCVASKRIRTDKD